jgi:hypothetical protein
MRNLVSIGAASAVAYAVVCLELIAAVRLLGGEMDYRSIVSGAGFWGSLALELICSCYLYSFRGREFRKISSELTSDKRHQYAIGYTSIALLFVMIVIVPALFFYPPGALVCAAIMVIISVYAGGYVRGWLIEGWTEDNDAELIEA